MIEAQKAILYEGVVFVIVKGGEIDDDGHYTITVKPVSHIAGKNMLKEELKTTENPYLSVANWFCAMKRLTHSNLSYVRTAKGEDGALVIHKLVEKDGYNIMTVVEVLNFSLTDSFWTDYLLTLTRIRDRSRNGQLKFENVKASMEIAKKKQFKKKKIESSYDELD